MLLPQLPKKEKTKQAETKQAETKQLCCLRSFQRKQAICHTQASLSLFFPRM